LNPLFDGLMDRIN